MLGSKTKKQKNKQPLKKADYIDDEELGSDSDIPRLNFFSVAHCITLKFAYKAYKFIHVFKVYFSLRNRHFVIQSTLVIADTLGTVTAAYLAQLVERQFAVREVEGSSPRPDQHSTIV